MKYILLSILLFTTSAFADIGEITYTAPTEREDNTPLAPGEIGGFNVYDQNKVLITALPADARSYQVQANGQTLYLTTFDTEGRESDFSQAVVIPAGKSRPRAPGGINIIIILDAGGNKADMGG